MRTIRLGDLPADMQQLIADIVDRYDLDDVRLPVHNVPMRRFPVLEYERTGDAREWTDYIEPMNAGTMPPIVLVGNKWIDGCHRVWAARHLRMSTILAIDLADSGLPLNVDHDCDVIATLN